MVSSVTCHMTWRVVEMEWAINLLNKMQWAIGFFDEKESFVRIASRSLLFALVSVRFREWNGSCSK
jgi:hypothetical protein